MRIIKREVFMVIAQEDQRKEAVEFFIKALEAARHSFVGGVSGASLARCVVEGAAVIEEYIYPKS